MDIVSLSTKVASQIGEQTLGSVGVPGGGSIIESLLSDLIGVQDEQARALSRIERDVQRLINEPWNTAQTYIKEAKYPGTSADQRRAKLLVAAEQLRRVVSLQEERIGWTLAPAYTFLDLAIVLRIAGDQPASKLYAAEAKEAARAYAQKVAIGLGDPMSAGVPVRFRPGRAGVVKPRSISEREWRYYVRGEVMAVGRAANAIIGWRELPRSEWETSFDGLRYNQAQEWAESLIAPYRSQEERDAAYWRAHRGEDD